MKYEAGRASVISSVLILLGALVPSRWILAALRDFPADPVLLSKQFTGVALFRAGIVILGILVPVLAGAMRRDRTPGIRKRFLVLPPKLAVLLLVAAALRFFDLGNGLWHDEILTYFKYIRAPIGVTLTTCEDANQQFLYTLMAQASVGVFGESNIAVRLPAVLFGLAGIWALYLLAIEVANEREALLSCLLLTVSYHHVWFSQNARGYTGLLFWTLLTSLLLLKALRENRAQWWIRYAVCVGFGMYTNLALLFVVVTHSAMWLHALIRRKGTWSGFWLGFVFSAFLTLLLYSLVLPQIFGAVGGEESTVPAWKEPLWALLEFVRALEVGFAGRVVAGIALLVFLAGFWSYLRSRPEIPVMLIVPVALCAGVTIALGHHVWPRLFFFAFGFGVLIAIRGAMIAGKWFAAIVRRPQWAITSGTAFCILMSLVSALSLVRVYGPKQDFEGALRYVQSNLQPGDSVAMVGLAALTYENFYKTDWKEVETVADLNHLRSGAKRTWLVYTFLPHARSVYPDVVALADREFQLQKEFSATVGAGQIFVLRSDHQSDSKR